MCIIPACPCAYAIQVGSLGEQYVTAEVVRGGKKTSLCFAPAFLCGCSQVRDFPNLSLPGFCSWVIPKTTLLMCLLSLSIDKRKYFVSYLELMLFAASKYSCSVSGQLPTTWVHIGAGASLWFSYSYVQPGVSWFSSAVLRRKGCSSACFWLVVLLSFGSDTMGDWVFGDIACFRLYHWSTLDVLWLSADVAGMSGWFWAWQMPSSSCSCDETSGRLEILNERLKVTNSIQSKLSEGDKGHFRISLHQWVVLQWSRLLSSGFSP